MREAVRLLMHNRCELTSLRNVFYKSQKVEDEQETRRRKVNGSVEGRICGSQAAQATTECFFVFFSPPDALNNARSLPFQIYLTKQEN